MADAPPPVDMVALVNAHLGGFERALGLTFTRITPDELVAEVPVGPALMQPYGIVHGGVYAAIIETLAGTGARLHAMREGKTSVGLESTTSFLRAVRGGKLVAVATPLQRGTTQVWEVQVSDERGRLLATGRVHTKSLEADTVVAGEILRVKT